MAPATYARLTRLALWALAAIVVTGAAVRLTGSGLGCPDWPTCSQDSFVADLEYHALVEFVNRLFTGVVAAAVIVAVAGSLKRRPRRRDLTTLSLGLVAGVLAQIALGALLVSNELDPRFTMGHFLLSMVLLWNAAVLDVRARRDAHSTLGGLRGAHPDGGLRGEAHPDGGPRGEAHPDGGPRGAHPDGGTPPRRGAHPDGLTRLMLWAVLGVGAALLVTGTLVTGAGPHAGDTRAERLPLLVREVARVHSIVAIVLLGMVVWTWWRLRSAGAGEHARMGRVAGLLVLQGAVGYTQYFAGVPVLLVGVHVALASMAWIEIVKAVHAPARTADQPGVAVDGPQKAVHAPVRTPAAAADRTTAAMADRTTAASPTPSPRPTPRAATASMAARLSPTATQPAQS